MKQPWDLIVVGGGAAGHFAAISCAEHMPPGARILILEKSSQVLAKVKISGGGRCNVTHACFDPKELVTFYPRGQKSLLGPFHRWGPSDTVQWFASHGVELKTEADGRMFPISNSSQTIIDSLCKTARALGVVTQVSEGVISIRPEAASESAETDPKNGQHRFTLATDRQNEHQAHHVLIASGGTRLSAGARLATSLGHKLDPNTPSLFAFNIEDERISPLPGVSVQNAQVSVPDLKLQAQGPLLITHQGLSGPGILRLSAWGARQLQQLNYRFQILVNWLPAQEVDITLRDTRLSWGKRQIHSRPPFEGFPKRLWQSLCHAAELPSQCLWSQLDKKSTQRLTRQLTECELSVSGKSINKDEFVTCGGVKLRDVNLKRMESKLLPGLYFAGEVLDIDGLTGGFNFQNAWTSGRLAGLAIAESSAPYKPYIHSG